MKPRFAVISGMILLAAISRLVPHPWNFTPVAAMALFAGAHFTELKTAIFIPIAALLIGDFFLGFYPGMWLTYFAFAVVSMLGLTLKNNKSLGRLFAVTLTGSVLFFVITNFAAWVYMPEYPRSFQGLMMSYSMAIPFFRNSLAGDLIFTGVLFGSFALAERSFPALRSQQVSA